MNWVKWWDSKFISLGISPVNKFRPRYYGPYKIIQVHPNRVTYIIEADHLGKQYRVHHRQLRKWKLPPEYLRNEFEFRDIMKSDEERQANIREEPNLVVEGKVKNNPSKVSPIQRRRMMKKGSLKGFEVDEEKLKQVKETLFRLDSSTDPINNGVEKDGVLENEQENIRITYQNSGSFEGFEPEEPPMIHGVERQIEVLVAGHSWARDMEDGFSQNLLPNVEVEFRSYPGITLSGLKDKMITILDATYTHLVVFVLISEAYKRQPLTNSPRDRGYWITVANLDYDNTQFCGQFDEFVRHCHEINPRLRILLIIPPFLDLAFYNSRRVSNFPQELQNLYNRQPEYATQLLHQQSVRMYNHLKTLRHDGYQWMGKETFPVMYAVTTLYGQRSRVRDFLEGRVWTLRQSGFLRDGLHPVALLCAKLWSRMNRARLFQLSVPGQLIVVNPVPDVPVGAPLSQIGQDQPSELDLSQPGPSGQGLSEVVELVVEEEVELLDRVIEREEDLNVVERERVEMNMNREEEVLGESEMPVQAVANLSLEENPSGEHPRRSYSPIRFINEPSPEVGGGPVRLREDRISRSRGSASSRRERRTPYVRPRSTNGVISGEGVQSGVASTGADEILRQWEVKLGELIAHMQGFLAAHGQETTPREIKDTIRRLWFQLISQRNQHRSSCNFLKTSPPYLIFENTRYCALPSREERFD
ncbi:hypothetical protein Anas_13098 [Armadillidium nasatum]|uniref:Uncharacterized protein n=1 Tax=Armadillidium nasatum TaxID=96803 RepID=A0A5N5SMY4_9CRUS|nr:hypothetical protein Anas_13098 [Armadillidium nasatum]